MRLGRARDDVVASVVLPRHAIGELPRWARVADGITLALLLLAIAVQWGGGFRERYFDVRVSLTSGWRLAALALAIAIARHAVRVSPPLWVRVHRAADRAWRVRAVRVAITAAVATRVAVLVAGYFASVTIAPVPGSVRFRDNTDTLSSLSAKWDAQWYQGIVIHGYQWDGNRQRQQNVVFFPVLPVLMYVVGLPLGRRWLVAGTLIGSVAFAWALLYLFRLARDQIEGIDDDAAASSVWLLATYPFAIYFCAPYTEGVYLLACVAGLYHAGRRETGTAVTWGVIAGLCRPNGFLLAVPLALLVGSRTVRAWRHRPEARPGPAAWPRSADVAVVVAPVVGLLLYSTYLWWQFGDPLAWQQGQLAWGRRYVGVWRGLEALFTQRWQIVAHMGLQGYTRVQPMDALNTAAAIFAVAALVPVGRRIGLAYAAFVAVNVFPPLLIGGTMSVGRMTSVMFPLFLWMGTKVPPSWLPAFTAGFATLQGLVAALFFTWRPAF